METNSISAKQLNNVLAAAAPVVLEETLGFLAAKHGVNKDAIAEALRAGHVGLLGQFEALNNAAFEVIVRLASERAAA